MKKLVTSILSLAVVAGLGLATAARAQLDAGQGDAAFLNAKLVTARFYAARLLPRTTGLLKEIQGGSEAMMALSPEDFARAA